MRLLKHHDYESRGGIAINRRNLLALGASLAIISGGVLSYMGVHNSPEARIARLTQRDHQRALHLAIHPTPTTPTTPTTSVTPTTPVTTTHVTWRPTLPNEVATISIPALGVSAAILAEGPANGALTIPPDVHNVGWDSQTPTPGLSGVTLLAGHVNWVGQGEGALGAIGQLVPGDRVNLDWKGKISSWQISTKPALSPNTEAHASLFSNQGPPRLALVTCGGPFKEIPGVGGSYADNVIVEAVPVGV
jgi:sortase (surface protein transpeptidase)